MTWRIAAALLAGLAVQLGIRLAEMVRLFTLHILPPLHPGLMAGMGVVMLAGIGSGLVVGAIAQRRPVLLGVLNALTPLGFYLLYYLGFLLTGLTVAGGDSGFVTALLVLTWQKLWLHYTLHAAATLLTSIIGASLGAAFSK